MSFAAICHPDHVEGPAWRGPRSCGSATGHLPAQPEQPRLAAPPQQHHGILPEPSPENGQSARISQEQPLLLEPDARAAPARAPRQAPGGGEQPGLETPVPSGGLPPSQGIPGRDQPGPADAAGQEQGIHLPAAAPDPDRRIAATQGADPIGNATVHMGQAGQDAPPTAEGMAPDEGAVSSAPSNVVSPGPQASR